MEKHVVRKSVSGQEFTVTMLRGDYANIRFTESGHECRAVQKLILKGLVFDPTDLELERNSWTFTQDFYTNSLGQDYCVFARNNKGQCKVKFLDTNSVQLLSEDFVDPKDNMKVYEPRDKFVRTVYGVGYLGDFDKSKTFWKQAKQLWTNMLKRCYCEKDVRGYFGQATVNPSWFSFENFLRDVENLRGFEGWLNGQKGGIKYNLDKDFYDPSNLEYSKHFCTFIPDSYNKSLGKKGKVSSKLGAD